MMIRHLSHSRIKKRRVLLRVDFNAPIAGGVVMNDFRMRAHLPAIRKLLRGGNTVILLSHHSNRRQTLLPIARRLGSLLGASVFFVKNPNRIIQTPKEKRLILFENLRFWPGEEGESRAFAQVLARWGDCFVNDAFAVAHRRGASITVLPRLLPSYLGPLFEKEFKMLDMVVKNPKRPLIAVFGGAKIDTKLALLRRFVRLADKVLVAGALANALLRARGFSVGRSAIDGRFPATMLRRIAASKKIILPVDALAARSLRAGRKVGMAPPVRFSGLGRGITRPIGAIKRNEIIGDIGPETVILFRNVLCRARTAVWNGPLGIAEVGAFSSGTRSLARALARSRARVIVGGGDTAAFLARERMIKKFRRVSTGGGAMLAYLSGEKLPAIEALRK